MTKRSFLAAAALAALVLPATLRADHHGTKDIVDTAVAAGDFKTLATALQAAGLIDTLKGQGPFTVFAPTDAAFAKLPKADLDALLNDKAKLTKVLTYHVVAGKMDSAALMKAIDVGGGKAMLTAVSGGMLTATKSGNAIMVADDSGGTAKVTIADVVQSNGVIHVVDKVLLPK
jgi:uncharacterized surface protein with fasciclin (FAS1) repeats